MKMAACPERETCEFYEAMREYRRLVTSTRDIQVLENYMHHCEAHECFTNGRCEFERMQSVNVCMDGDGGPPNRLHEKKCQPCRSADLRTFVADAIKRGEVQ